MTPLVLMNIAGAVSGQVLGLPRGTSRQWGQESSPASPPRCRISRNLRTEANPISEGGVPTA